MNIMDIQQILQHLPHRYPFLLVDRVLEIIPNHKITAIKNVTCNEPFFTGHFPQRMVMPGVLILEALAQAGALFASKTNLVQNSLFLFAGIENARFKRIVEPGDQLRLEVSLVKHKQAVWKFSGIATVDGELACSADMTSVVQKQGIHS